MQSNLPVLISGGGIGGLVAALCLLQRGRDVKVFEQAAEFKGLGAGVQISANGTRVLCALGLRAEMEKVADAPYRKEVRLFNTGQTWELFNLTDNEQIYGSPYWMVHRGDFHKVLLAELKRLKPDALHAGARGESFEQDDKGVTLTLSTGEKVRGSMLIGADGVHSQVRKQLFGESLAKFTGFCAWRGVIEMDKLPQGMRRVVGTNWIGPHGHVVMYPLRRGELLNFVAAIEKDDWKVESWTERGSIDEMLTDFAIWHDDVKEIASKIDIPYKWALLTHDELPKWSVGRVTLLGDACHPTLPFMAQGANMAIEDGMVLARAIDEYADPETALQKYEAARKPRTAKLVTGANNNVKTFHNPELANPDTVEAYVSGTFNVKKNTDLYGWVYEYDAMNVPI